METVSSMYYFKLFMIFTSLVTINSKTTFLVVKIFKALIWFKSNVFWGCLSFTTYLFSWIADQLKKSIDNEITSSEGWL